MKKLYTLQAILPSGTVVNGHQLYWNREYAELKALDIHDKLNCIVNVKEYDVDEDLFK